VRFGKVTSTFVAFALVWAADTLLTAQGILRLGLEAEANPLIRWVWGWGGVGLFSLCKLATLGVMWYLIRDGEHLGMAWVLTILTLFLGVIPWLSVLRFC